MLTRHVSLQPSLPIDQHLHNICNYILKTENRPSCRPAPTQKKDIVFPKTSLTTWVAHHYPTIDNHQIMSCLYRGALSSDQHVRYWALHMLFEIHRISQHRTCVETPEIRDTLCTHVDNRTQNTLNATVQLLASFTKPPYQATLMGTDRIITTFIRAIETQNDFIKHQSLSAIDNLCSNTDTHTRIGTPRFFNALSPLLNSPNASIPTVVANIIYQLVIGQQPFSLETLSALAQIIPKLVTHTIDDVQAIGVKNLSHIANHQSAKKNPHLSEILNNVIEQAPIEIQLSVTRAQLHSDYETAIENIPDILFKAIAYLSTETDTGVAAQNSVHEVGSKLCLLATDVFKIIQISPFNTGWKNRQEQSAHITTSYATWQALMQLSNMGLTALDHHLKETLLEMSQYPVYNSLLQHSDTRAVIEKLRRGL